MKVEVSEEYIGKNIHFLDLAKIIYEFDKKNNKSKAEREHMFDSLKIHLIEQPDRELIYSNEFVLALIDLYENNTLLNDTYSSYAEKIGFIKDNKKTDNFMEIMNYTHDNYGYDFGYIQDQAWYKLYPKYL